VRDEGPGIAAEDQERIFDRFARASSHRPDGTGLGLAIVRAIAEAHGGRVELRSAPGAGSTFILDLPTEPPEELDAP
jgi:signal transduction histidine kinase